MGLTPGDAGQTHGGKRVMSPWEALESRINRDGIQIDRPKGVLPIPASRSGSIHWITGSSRAHPPVTATVSTGSSAVWRNLASPGCWYVRRRQVRCRD